MLGFVGLVWCKAGEYKGMSGADLTFPIRSNILLGRHQNLYQTIFLRFRTDLVTLDCV